MFCRFARPSNLATALSIVSKTRLIIYRILLTLIFIEMVQAKWFQCCLLVVGLGWWILLPCISKSPVRVVSPCRRECLFEYYLGWFPFIVISFSKPYSVLDSIGSEMQASLIYLCLSHIFKNSYSFGGGGAFTSLFFYFYVDFLLC